jgi:hypothetical protein
MRAIGQMIAAVLRALSAAAIGTWQLVWEGARQVMRFIPKPPAPEPLPAALEEPAPDDVAAGLRAWASGRTKGQMPRLPPGVTPPLATWALRLSHDELAMVARTAPAVLRQHLTGAHQLNGVRPVLTIVKERANQIDDPAAETRRQIRAEMRALRLEEQARWEREQPGEAPRLAI